MFFLLFFFNWEVFLAVVGVLIVVVVVSVVVVVASQVKRNVTGIRPVAGSVAALLATTASLAATSAFLEARCWVPAGVRCGVVGGDGVVGGVVRVPGGPVWPKKMTSVLREWWLTKTKDRLSC